MRRTARGLEFRNSIAAAEFAAINENPTYGTQTGSVVVGIVRAFNAFRAPPEWSASLAGRQHCIVEVPISTNVHLMIGVAASPVGPRLRVRDLVLLRVDGWAAIVGHPEGGCFGATILSTLKPEWTDRGWIVRQSFSQR